MVTTLSGLKPFRAFKAVYSSLALFIGFFSINIKERATSESVT